MVFREICIIGAGALGTALAINLSKKSGIRLVFRTADQADEARESRRNDRALPGFPLPEKVVVTADLKEALDGADLVMIATPTGAFEEMLRAVKETGGTQPVIWCCKGLCPVTGQPLSEKARAILGEEATYGVLSGPSFAQGMAAGDPTAVVICTNKNHKVDLKISAALSNQSLRIYANSDLVGVQICGAIKNVYAIAAGIIDGCGWKENTRAAMISRAMAEAKRYLKLHRSKRSTLMGLSGFGDFFLTCGSRTSRNYQLGMALAHGKTLEDALQSLGHVAEGVNACRLISRRAEELGVEMPLLRAVGDVLDGRRSARECADALMSRRVRHERARLGENDT